MNQIIDTVDIEVCIFNTFFEIGLLFHAVTGTF